MDRIGLDAIVGSRAPILDASIVGLVDAWDARCHVTLLLTRNRAGCAEAEDRRP